MGSVLQPSPVSQYETGTPNWLLRTSPAIYIISTSLFVHSIWSIYLFIYFCVCVSAPHRNISIGKVTRVVVGAQSRAAKERGEDTWQKRVAKMGREFTIELNGPNSILRAPPRPGPFLPLVSSPPTKSRPLLLLLKSVTLSLSSFGGMVMADSEDFFNSSRKAL